MAKREKRNKTAILTRTEKWPLKLAPKQERLLIRISDGLRDYCNWAVAVEKRLYEIRELVKQIPAEPAPTVERIGKSWNYSITGFSIEQEEAIARVAEALIECYLSPQPDADAVCQAMRLLFARRLMEREAEEKPRKKTNRKRNPWASLLTPAELYLPWGPQRAADAWESSDGIVANFRGRIPANWVVETFGAVVGSLKSFFALRGNEDPDAHSIGYPRKEWRFQAIPGCSAFSIKQDRVVLAPEIFGRDALSFPIPPDYQARMLARSTRLEKFVIRRENRDLREPSRFFISVSYEIPKPEPVPFVAEKGVFIAPGASSIGIISQKGDEVIPLWRADKYWKPQIDELEPYLGMCRDPESGKFLKAVPFGNVRPAMTRGSKRWRKLRRSHALMNGMMAKQQTQDRREVAAIDALEHTKELTPNERRFERRRGVRQGFRLNEILLEKLLGHGVHFVFIHVDIRSKPGKLADASKSERGGQLGLNWMAQNTGSMAYFRQWLEKKAPEFGGSVRTYDLPWEALPRGLPKGHENKIPRARALRAHFLKHYSEAA